MFKAIGNILCYAKAPETSASLRKRGNEEFVKGNWYGALYCYNRALVTIKPDDPDRNKIASFCYANRSAVYLELKHFKLCLQNIELAEPNYPREKIQKLHDRRQKCIELMKTEEDKEIELPGNPFKLSYPANPKLPFFIEALQLKTDENGKKRMITTRDLKAGDVIVVVDVSICLPGRLGDKHVMTCQNCMNLNHMSLKLHDDCEGGLFCSDKCHDEHMQFDHRADKTVDIIRSYNPRKLMSAEEISSNDFHAIVAKIFLHLHDAFGSVAAMKKFVESQRKRKHEVFDLDWNDEEDPQHIKNMFAALLSTLDERNPFGNSGFSMMRKHFEQYMKGKSDDELMRIFKANKKHHDFIDVILYYIYMAAYHKHSIYVTIRAGDEVGMYFEPWQSLVSFSCDPNITIYPFIGKQTIWMAERPIKAGSEILVAEGKQYFYHNGPGTSECNNATCSPCKSGWRSSISANNVKSESDKSFVLYRKYERWYELENMMQQIKITTDYLNENFDLDKYLKSAQHREEIAIKSEELRIFLILISQQHLTLNMVSDSNLTWHDERKNFKS